MSDAVTPFHVANALCLLPYAGDLTLPLQLQPTEWWYSTIGHIFTVTWTLGSRIQDFLQYYICEHPIYVYVSYIVYWHACWRTLLYYIISTIISINVFVCVYIGDGVC